MLFVVLTKETPKNNGIILWDKGISLRGAINKDDEENIIAFVNPDALFSFYVQMHDDNIKYGVLFIENIGSKGKDIRNLKEKIKDVPTFGSFLFQNANCPIVLEKRDLNNIKLINQLDKQRNLNKNAIQASYEFHLLSTVDGLVMFSGKSRIHKMIIDSVSLDSLKTAENLLVQFLFSYTIVEECEIRVSQGLLKEYSPYSQYLMKFLSTVRNRYLESLVEQKVNEGDMTSFWLFEEKFQKQLAEKFKIIIER